MIVYGIDVGTTGAIAVLVNGRLEAVDDLPAHISSSGVVRRRLDPAGLAAMVRGYRAQYGVDAELATVEQLAAMPKQGVASVFSLGYSAGVVAGVVASLGIPTHYVAPGTWKRAMGLGADKARSQAMASQMFPAMAGHWTLAKHHNRAEAALLAAYGAKQ